MNFPGQSKIILAIQDHLRHNPSLKTHHGSVKASQPTLDDQDLLQDQQHCSRSTTTCPGNIIIIPPNPDHHHHHPDLPWTTQSLPGSSWSTKSTTRVPTLFQVHSSLSGLLHTYSNHSRPSLPSTITPELPWTSHSLSDHSRQPWLTPWLPALFQANHDLSWSLQTYPSYSRLPTTSSIISELPWTSHTLPDHSTPTRITIEPAKLFQTHTDLS